MQNGDAEKAGDYFAKAAALDPENKASRPRWRWSIWPRAIPKRPSASFEQIASVDTGNRADMALILASEAAPVRSGAESRSPRWPRSSRTIRWSIQPARHGAARQGRPRRRPQELRTGLEQESRVLPGGSQSGQSRFGGQEAGGGEEALRGCRRQGSEGQHAGHARAGRTALKTGGKTEEVAALINKAIAAQSDGGGTAPGADRPLPGQAKDVKKRGRGGPGCACRVARSRRRSSMRPGVRSRRPGLQSGAGDLWQAGRI
jgi:hypothetical protein